jgi:hypothetical protein
MRVLSSVVALACVVLSPSPLLAQDGYVPLRANLHVHSVLSNNVYASDDKDHVFCPLPSELMDQAADHGLNIVGFSEHGNMERSTTWSLEGSISRPGGPVALRGFEWTGSSDHCNVFGSDTYTDPTITADDAMKPTKNLAELYTWLEATAADPSHGTIVAQFNHIQLFSDHGGEFGGFAWNEGADAVFRLAELGYPPNPRNEPAVYHNIAASEGDWRKALQKGWHVAPSVGADNQFGLGDAQVDRCTGVWINPNVAGSERQQVMEALKAGRVYATEARHARLRFRFTRDDIAGDHDWKWMGDRIDVWAGDKLLLDVDVSCPSAGLLEVLDSVKIMSSAEEPGVIKDFGDVGGLSFQGQLELDGTALKSYLHTERGEVCLYVRVHHKASGHTFSAPIWITPHQKKYNSLVVPSITTALGQTAQLTARLTDRVGAGIAGRILSITVDGEPAQNVTPTDANGYATASLSIPADECPGSREIRVSLASDSEYEDNDATAKLVVGAPSDNVIRVSPTGSDAYSGRCWGYPKRSIQAALNACPEGGEVWVAGGSYAGGASFTGLITLLGGFLGSEVSSSQRDPSRRDAIIDGSVVPTKISINANRRGQLRVDGFTLKNAGLTINGTSSAPDVTLTNITFSDASGGFGGSIGSIAVQNCQVIGAKPVIEMGGLSLSRDSVFDVPCIFDLSSASNITVGQGATLTLAGGTVFRGGYRDDDYWGSHIYSYSRIVVNGSLRPLTSASAPVLFTSDKDDSPFGGEDATPSDYKWDGIQYGPGTKTDLQYVTVKHANTGLSVISANLDHCQFLQNGTAVTSNAGPWLASITNCVFDQNGTVVGQPVLLALSNNQFTGNSSNCYGYVRDSITISGNTFQGSGFNVDTRLFTAAGTVTIIGNVFEGKSLELSGGDAIPPDLIIANNTMTGIPSARFTGLFGALRWESNQTTGQKPVIEMGGLGLSKDSVFDVPCIFNLSSASNLTVDQGATLTLAGGTVVRGGYKDDDYWGSHVYSYSRIVVNGSLRLLTSASAPVLFTSDKDDSPFGGEDATPPDYKWYGIQYGPGTSTDLQYVTVKHANTGLSVVSANLDHCQFIQNVAGVQSALGGGVITACGFSGNSYGILNASVADIDARYNDWGDPSGPYHQTLNPTGKGNPVSDHVLFDPWQGKAGVTYFTVVDVANAMRVAAGLAVPAAGDVARLDVVKAGTSNGSLDILDAIRLARKAAGVEANP